MDKTAVSRLVLKENWMRRIIAVIAAAILLGDEGISRAVQIPPEVKQAVAFIYIEKSKGLEANGTGFFVAIPYPSDKGQAFGYLVTARHVLKAEGKSVFLPRIFVRLNTLKGTSEMLPITLVTNGSQKNVFVHEDPTVDLAVISLFPDQSKYEFNLNPA